MATQASAITMIGTTGQGWVDGMRFVQFYLALPLAMVILAVTLVPHYHRLQVHTAYEYLGERFDAKTRLLGAALFLFLRGLSVGFVIYAPSLVLSKVFGMPLGAMVLVMGGVAVAYTTMGGLGAVIATDVKQMTVMVAGLGVAVVMVIVNMPPDVGLDGAMTLARETGRLQLVDWSWDPSEKYTIWSSLIGGLFLFLSYFGTDQSQAQRLLAGRSLPDMRKALFLNAIAKVPFQLLGLFIGAMLFVFYLFAPTPISFDPTADDEAAALPTASLVAYEGVLQSYASVHAALPDAARAALAAGPGAPETTRYRELATEWLSLRDEARVIRGGTADTHYVFLDFILTALPVGLVGLLLAAIFAAALSSIDSELNAMTTVAVLDIVQFVRRSPLDGARLVVVSRVATVIVGALATIFALYAGNSGSLIEAVNQVGSYVYGSLLGAFVLAVGFRRANGHGTFVGLLTGMVVVGVAARTDLAFLYLNTVGTVTVVVVGLAVSLATGGRGRSSEA